MTILQDDRINELPALHAASGSGIKVTTAIHEIEALLDDHQPSAPGTARCVRKLIPTSRILFVQVFHWKSECLNHRRPPSFIHCLSANPIRACFPAGVCNLSGAGFDLTSLCSQSTASRMNSHMIGMTDDMNTTSQDMMLIPFV